MKSSTKNSILAILVLIVASCVPALIFGKWLEAIIFNVCHSLIRPQFPKEYHHIVHSICREITACVLFFGISFTLPLELSLLSAIPINYFNSWVGFTKKNSDDFEVECEELKEKCDELEEQIETLIEDLKKYKQIDLYKMSEEELRQFAQSKGLSETICDTLVLRIIHNYRWVDIETERNFTKRGIDYHKEQIIKKLGFKP